MDEEKKPDTKTPEDHHEKKTIIITAVITILAVAFIGGLIYFGKNYRDKKKELDLLREQIENQQKGAESPGEVSISGELGSNETFGTEAAADEYAGWKTYTNSGIGYTLQYPADWTVEETDKFDEFRETMVKYITIESPQKKYRLHWGLKEKNDDFGLTDRTGVGAGDLAKDGKITILGTLIDVQKMVLQGKTKEIFYSNSGMGENLTKDGLWKFQASLGTGDGIDSNSADISTAPEAALADKILKSVSLIQKTPASGCPQNFTNEENLNKADWKTYKNDKYGYSFQYPKNWHVITEEDKRVALGNDADKIYFTWNSEEMTAFDYMGYDITSEKNMTVACQDAKETFLSGDPTADPPGEADSRLIFADFKKNSKRHLLTFSYKYVGASISSDVVEMFDLILKTVKFNK